MPDKKRDAPLPTRGRNARNTYAVKFSASKRPSNFDPTTATVEDMIDALSAPYQQLDGVTTKSPPYSIVPARVAKLPIINSTALRTLIVICSTCDRRGVTAMRGTTIQKMLGNARHAAARKVSTVDVALDILERHGIIRRWGEWPNNRIQVIYDPTVDPDEILGRVSPSHTNTVITDDETVEALKKGTGQKNPVVQKIEEDKGHSDPPNLLGGRPPADLDALAAANQAAAVDRVKAFSVAKARRLWGIVPAWPASDAAFIEQLVIDRGYDRAIKLIDEKVDAFRRFNTRPPASIEGLCK